MDVKSQFSTNTKKETEGVWIKGGDGAEFLIARANNPAALKLSVQLMRPYRALQRAGQVPKDVQEDVGLEVLSRTILLDWKGVKEGAEEVAFTPDEAKRMLKTYPEFADFIAAIAQDYKNFQDEDEKARQGNSSSASAGSSPGGRTETSSSKT
jgi:hypothetical protein